MWQRGLLKLIDFEGWIHRDGPIQVISDVSPKIAKTKYIGIKQFILIPMYGVLISSKNT